MTWQDCTRCPRHLNRKGGYQPNWPPAPLVVLLSERPHRSELGAGSSHSNTARLLEMVCLQLGLPRDAVVHDYLVSCGSHAGSPEEIASCVPRLEELVSSRPSVRAVVVLGERTQALAQLAGLYQGDYLLGRPTLSLPSGTNPFELAALAGLLGRSLPRQPQPDRRAASELAAALLAAQGPAKGSSIKTAKGWRRRPTVRLSGHDVHQHLAGEGIVAPFAPSGDWPFVVLDVDRHDALQEERFPETQARLRALLPHSFIVRSSFSQGIHVYVRLPPGTRYETGALYMRAFLILHGLRFAEAVLLDGKAIRSELVEAKNHPPRLPFGVGSCDPRSTEPLANQIRQFLLWRDQPEWSDFERCRAHVASKVAVPKRWDAYARYALRQWIHLREAGGCDAPVLPERDPWAPVLPHLPPHLRGIAARGVPYYGSRTTWTSSLLRALTGIVAQDEALKLMEFWILSRDHISEDIEDNPDGVVLDLRTQIESEYNRALGVPSSHWARIEQYVLRSLKNARLHPKEYPELIDAKRLVAEEVLATAFCIARRFYRAQRATRRIPMLEFAEFAGRNAAHDVQEVLSWDMSWLSFQRKAAPGSSAKEFRLLLWPAPPLEETVVLPPSGLPARKYWVDA